MTHYPDASALGLTFRKSSYSNAQENCVEYATSLAVSGAVVRDSKDPHGPALAFPSTPGGPSWRAFTPGASLPIAEPTQALGWDFPAERCAWAAIELGGDGGLVQAPGRPKGGTATGV